jgi:hypothetical protein
MRVHLTRVVGESKAAKWLRRKVSFMSEFMLLDASAPATLG